MSTTLGFLPLEITAGETIWLAAANTLQGAEDIIITDYTPVTDTLAYDFGASTPINVTAVKNAADTGWTLEVTGAQTLLWFAGKLKISGLVTSISTERITSVDIGTINVLASPAQTSDYQAALTAIEAAIATFASNPSSSLTIDNMSISYNSVDDLLKLRTHYNGLVQSQLGTRSKRIIRTRFR